MNALTEMFLLLLALCCVCTVLYVVWANILCDNIHQTEDSMTKTKTIHHEYGTETIELAECDSCGQETKEEKMREFRIYDNEFGDYVSGSICPSCRDLDNPIEYPSVDRPIQDNLSYVVDVGVGLSFISLTMLVCFLLLSKIIGLIGGVI